LLAGCFAYAQMTPEARVSGLILLKADRILDIKAGHYIEAAGILIERDRIKEIGRAAEIAAHRTKDVPVLDLASVTLLPGLVDCHTHLMAVLRVTS
jgi:imidazolonepropionase-like amidohydrolase